jgi:hypothetical protein
MVRKITPDILKKMQEMRMQGATYSEIQLTLGVTKERCIAYLKDIEPCNQCSAMTIGWQIAEHEAVAILEKMGFSHIVNLNDICNVAPYWDYYCEKNTDRWLIDVTINGQKSLMAKQERCVDGYSHAILLKNPDQWKFIELKAEVKLTIPIETI